MLFGKYTVSNNASLNAYFPIYSTPSSITNFVSVVALYVPSNADSPISLTLPGMVSEDKWCRWNAFSPILTTDFGIARAVNLAPANALAPISVTVSGISMDSRRIFMENTP